VDARLGVAAELQHAGARGHKHGPDGDGDQDQATIHHGQ